MVINERRTVITTKKINLFLRFYCLVGREWRNQEGKGSLLDSNRLFSFFIWNQLRALYRIPCNSTHRLVISFCLQDPGIAHERSNTPTTNEPLEELNRQLTHLQFIWISPLCSSSTPTLCSEFDRLGYVLEECSFSLDLSVLRTYPAQGNNLS